MGSDEFCKGHCFMFFLLIFFSGFSLHSRLLEISDSLSWDEVKKIKFLVKSKVNGFRLARITEAFELFEELETNGVFPCHYIANLLVGIQRYDLVEKLGIQLPLTAAKHGNHEKPQSFLVFTVATHSNCEMNVKAVCMYKPFNVFFNRPFIVVGLVS